MCLQANCSSDQHLHWSRVWLLTCSHAAFIVADSDVRDFKVRRSGCRHETTANALRYSNGMSVLLQGAGIAQKWPAHCAIPAPERCVLPCSFALYLLARHPAALEQLLHEVDAFGRTRVRALPACLLACPSSCRVLLLQHGQSYQSSIPNADSREQSPARWACCILVLQCMPSGGSHSVISSNPPAADSNIPPDKSEKHGVPRLPTQWLSLPAGALLG